MDYTVVVLALISAIITPVVVAWIMWRGWKLNWERQDKVALALIQQNAIVAAANRVQNAKLDVIHTLVNSEMTAAKQSEHDARSNELVALLEAVDVRRLQGREPTTEGQTYLAGLRSRIAALRVELDERQRLQKLVDAQAAQSK